MLGRRPRVVLKGLAVFIAAALTCGVLYEQIGHRQDRRRLPQIGRSVDIGGRTLNIFCSGRGGPAVIFESASGIGLEWQPAQTEVASFTEACWYDRAGMGWSDPGPFPNTGEAIARDLHELLKRAGVPPPYVLAGFSFGGLPLREYGGLYPNEVAGMILVDSAQEDEPLRAPKFYLAHTAPRFLWRPLDLAFRSAAVVGLIRLTQSSRGQSKSLSQMTREEVIAALRITLGRNLDSCQDALHRPGTELFVARNAENDQPIGFLLVALHGLAGSPYIASIAVAAEMRSQGIGSELLRFAEKRFAERAHFFLLVSSFNQKAQQLYLRQGYKRVGELKDYCVPGQSEIIFLKGLT